MAEISRVKTAAPPGGRDDPGEEPLADLIRTLFPREAAKPVRYRKRSYIYHQGDRIEAVWCVMSGTVALERLDGDGRMAIFGMMKAGTVLAWHDLVEGGCHRNSAETLSCCDMVPLPCAAFVAALHEDDRLVGALMRQAAAQVDAYEEHILRLSTLEVPERLYSTLRALAGTPDGEEDTVEFSVPLLRRDLAAMIGTSPEGISRGIRRLEQMDVAEFSGRTTVRLRVQPRR